MKCTHNLVKFVSQRVTSIQDKETILLGNFRLICKLFLVARVEIMRHWNPFITRRGAATPHFFIFFLLSAPFK